MSDVRRMATHRCIAGEGRRPLTGPATTCSSGDPAAATPGRRARRALQAAGDDVWPSSAQRRAPRPRRRAADRPNPTVTPQVGRCRPAKYRCAPSIVDCRELDPRGATVRVTSGLVHAEVPVDAQPQDGEIESTPIDPSVDRRALGVEVVGVDIDRPVVGRFDVIDEHPSEHGVAGFGLVRRQAPELVQQQHGCGGERGRATLVESLGRRGSGVEPVAEADAQGPASAGQPLEQGVSDLLEPSPSPRRRYQMTRSTNSPVAGSLRISLRRPSGRCSSLMTVSSPSLRAVLGDPPRRAVAPVELDRLPLPAAASSGSTHPSRR